MEKLKECPQYVFEYLIGHSMYTIWERAQAGKYDDSVWAWLDSMENIKPEEIGGWNGAVD